MHWLKQIHVSKKGFWAAFPIKLLYCRITLKAQFFLIFVDANCPVLIICCVSVDMREAECWLTVHVDMTPVGWFKSGTHVIICLLFSHRYGQPRAES